MLVSRLLPKLQAAGFTEERLKRYRAYHTYLTNIGQQYIRGTTYQDSPKVDFPGEYSQKKLFREIIEECGGAIPTKEQEEWQVGRQEIALIAGHAMQVLVKRFGKGDEFYNIWQELTVKYLERLEKAGYTKDRTRYAAFHIILGSGIVYDEHNPLVDFPGDLSVRKFYEDIIKKYGGTDTE